MPFSGYVLYQTPGIISGSSTNPPFTSFSFGSSDLVTLTVGSYTFSVAGGNANSSFDAFGVTQDSPISGDVFSAGVDGENASAINSNLAGFSPNFLVFQIAGPPGLLSNEDLPTTIDFSKVAPGGYGNASTGIAVQTFGIDFSRTLLQRQLQLVRNSDSSGTNDRNAGGLCRCWIGSVQKGVKETTV
jgi:hypothetical protein